jgi:hypothetical protein
MYTKGEDTSWWYPVEKGKSISSSHHPVQVHVWSDSIIMSGVRNKMLNTVHVDIGHKLKKNVEEMDLIK